MAHACSISEKEIEPNKAPALPKLEHALLFKLNLFLWISIKPFSLKKWKDLAFKNYQINPEIIYK